MSPKLKKVTKAFMEMESFVSTMKEIKSDLFATATDLDLTNPDVERDFDTHHAKQQEQKAEAFSTLNEKWADSLDILAVAKDAVKDMRLGSSGELKSEISGSLENMSDNVEQIKNNAYDFYADEGFNETLDILEREVSSLKASIKEANKLEKASVELDNEMTM